MRKKILTVLAVAFAMTGCNKEESSSLPDNGQVIFTSGTEMTRVGGDEGDEWDGNETIGIYMVKHGEYTIVDDTENIEYKAVSAGKSTSFSPVLDTDMIYYPPNGKVDFIAYHPYDGTVDNYIYPVDVSQQSDQSTIDFMLAKADNNGAGYNKEETSVNLNFRHQLAKLVMNVTAGDGITSLSGLTVAITGMNIKAEFDMESETLVQESTPAGISPYGAQSDRFEAILLPVNLTSAHIVKFTLGNDIYQWDMTENVTPDGKITSLEDGKIYTFHITIQKQRVLATGSITPWESTPTATGTAQ